MIVVIIFLQISFLYIKRERKTNRQRAMSDREKERKTKLNLRFFYPDRFKQSLQRILTSRKGKKKVIGEKKSEAGA